MTRKIKPQILPHVSTHVDALDADNNSTDIRKVTRFGKISKRQFPFHTRCHTKPKDNLKIHRKYPFDQNRKHPTCQEKLSQRLERKIYEL